MSTLHLPDLARDLASDGFAGHEIAVRAVVRLARQRSVSPTLVGILADPDEPEVARLRAFGRIAVALDASRSVAGVRSAA